VDRPALIRISLFAALLLGATVAPVRAAELFGTTIPEETDYDGGTHFVLPNEYAFQAFESALQGKKGVFISVGTFRTVHESLFADFDQVVMLDHDPVVSEFNRQILTLAAHAQNREEFLKELLALDPRYRDLPNRIFGRFKEGGSWEKTIFGSDAVFEKFKQGIAAGKYLVMTASLTGNRTMPALASALKKAGAHVSALDVSNSPDYIASATGYADTPVIAEQFKKNIAALPWAEDGVVLHTVPKGDLGLPRDRIDDWVYFSTPVRDFVSGAEQGAFLNSQNAVRFSKELLSKRVKDCVSGFFRQTPH
jgi:hypothetical protein